MNNDSRLCDKCGLLPQTGSKPKPPCKPKCKKRCKKDCCENDFVFRKVVIPAALGDDVNGKDTPANGAYVNAYVEYEANGAQYMYDSYGVYTKLEVKSQEGVTNFDELSGRPKYAGNPMTSATDIPDVMSAPTFKPFPDGVVTDGTTQQFMNSILALDPTVGTAYMGTVELSDMPAGLIQEEVEVYVYNSYTIYCIMRSTDVAPYSWWCASYNYQGWQPIGSGGGMTIFYANSQETGATRHIYKDDHFTEEASVQDLLDANDEGPITLRITIYPNVNGVFSDAYIQNTYVGENDYQFLFLDERTYREYTASTTSDTTFYYFSNVIQTQLTAGSNIQINGTTISATDTTYSNFTGTDGTSVGAAGLVPAPATTDTGKYLKADGTWDSVQAGPTVVQTTGTSQTDVMSQKATSNLVYPAGAETNKEKIAIGNNASTGSGSNGIAIGNSATTSGVGGLAIGWEATSTGQSVALGRGSTTTRGYEVAVGSGAATYGTRFIANVTDPTLAQDAATKNYTDNLVINYSALNGASAPTTATEAKYVGQLYYDTTNDDMYYCSAITAQGTTPETYTYTWNTIGGSSVTVVQATGTSTTDVMSQAAATNMIYPSGQETTHNNIIIGADGTPTPSGSTGVVAIGPGKYGQSQGSQQAVRIGYNNRAGKNSVAVGYSADAKEDHSIAIGNSAYTNYGGSTIIGSGANGNQQQTVAIGRSASAGNTRCIAIGYNANAGNNEDTIAIGGSAKAFGSGSIVIGHNVYAPAGTGGDGCVVIGHGSAANTQYTTRNNEFCVHASTTANQPMIHSNVDTPTLGTDAANKNYVDSIYPVGAVFTSTSATAPTIAGGTWTEIGTQTIGSSTVHYYERTA